MTNNLWQILTKATLVRHSTLTTSLRKEASQVRLMKKTTTWRIQSCTRSVSLTSASARPCSCSGYSMLSGTLPSFFMPFFGHWIILLGGSSPMAKTLDSGLLVWPFTGFASSWLTSNWQSGSTLTPGCPLWLFWRVQVHISCFTGSFRWCLLTKLITCSDQRCKWFCSGSLSFSACFRLMPSNASTRRLWAISGQDSKKRTEPI